LTRTACHDADVPERPDSDREVLTSLPRSRPVRRSAKRADRPASGGAAHASAKPPAPRKPRATKAAAKPGAPAKPAAAGRAARPRATAKPNPAPTPPPVAERTPVPPQRKIPAAGYAAPDARAGEPHGSPAAELISTTIQAAAELAQIGMTVGRQTLQSMLDRLPKP
jgi:hypothetical protein